MVAVMLAGVMFPLWPVKLRIGVWYLSVAALGFVGAFIVLAIIRLIFWCITKIFMAKAIWMFPNLFEDVGFVSLREKEDWRQLLCNFAAGSCPFDSLTHSLTPRSTRSSPSGHGTSPRRRSSARSARSGRARTGARRPTRLRPVVPLLPPRSRLPHPVRVLLPPRLPLMPLPPPPPLLPDRRRPLPPRPLLPRLFPPLPSSVAGRPPLSRRPARTSREDARRV